MALVGLKQSPAERYERRREQADIFEPIMVALLAGELLAARKALGGSLAEFQRWVETFYPEHEVAVAEALGPEVERYATDVAEMAMAEIGRSGFAVGVAALAASYTEAVGKRWVSHSLRGIRSLLRDEPEPVDPILARLDTWEENRARLTAESEATQANGAVTKISLTMAGIERLMWSAIGESCPLCMEMDGRQIEVGGVFLEEGDEVFGFSEERGQIEMTAHRSVGHPPLHGLRGGGGICDCILEAV